MKEGHKYYRDITTLHEADMPSEQVLKNPKKLCIDQYMCGKWVGVQWTHYGKNEETGRTEPQFLEIGHDGKARPQYRLGLKEAQRWIAASDAYVDDHLDAFPDRKKWMNDDKGSD